MAPFHFFQSVSEGNLFEVTVAQHPTLPLQTCTPSGVSGNMHDQAISGVSIKFITEIFFVGGSVENLEGEGLILTPNEGEQEAATSICTTFQFPDKLLADSPP